MESKTNESKEVIEQNKKLFGLQDKTKSNYSMTSNLESLIEGMTLRLETSNSEKDKYEREIFATKSELTKAKKILDSEHEERKELEAEALNLIKNAKKKWDTEKNIIIELNKQIESQTICIIKLSTSNSQISFKLQRIEIELEATNAELHKLRVFQVQYKESLNKMRELSQQSTSVQDKLEHISTKAHNQVTDLKSKLELTTDQSLDVENKLKYGQDLNQCMQSRLSTALELVQNELKDYQKELKSLTTTICIQDKEIGTLKKQLHEKFKQLENANASTTKLILSLQKQLDDLKMENNQLKQQLQDTKLDLNETIINLKLNKTSAINLEKTTYNKVASQEQLKSTLQETDGLGHKTRNLGELIDRFRKCLTKLEVENANLKMNQNHVSLIHYSNPAIENSIKISSLKQQIVSLEQQLMVARENAAIDRQVANQILLNLWKKEMELSDVNLYERIALRQAKMTEERLQDLQEDKKKLTDILNAQIEEKEKKAKAAVKELDCVKSSLTDAIASATTNELQANSAQNALTEANAKIEELENSNIVFRCEFDTLHEQLRDSQNLIDSIKSEKEQLSIKVVEINEKNNEDKIKLKEIEQEINDYQLNIEFLKETCTILEEQFDDYEKLISDYEIRENTLMQEKIQIQNDLQIVEQKLSEINAALIEEKTIRLMRERTIECFESTTNNIGEDGNDSIERRKKYKKLIEKLDKQIIDLQQRCGKLECDLSKMKRSLKTSKAETRIVKEENTRYLTRVHELNEVNVVLMADLQDSTDQEEELIARIMELEKELEEIRQIYQEREIKVGSTCQQQTALIDFLQTKFEEISKRKNTCYELLCTRQGERTPIINMNALPVGYRKLKKEIELERAKVKALSEQLLAVNDVCTTSPSYHLVSTSLERLSSVDTTNEAIAAQTSMQRMRHNIPHKFNISLPMRTGNCSTCTESIQYGKWTAVCSQCDIMTHLNCSVSVLADCGLADDFPRQIRKKLTYSSESPSSFSDSIQNLAIDELDEVPQRDTDCVKRLTTGNILMESWVKILNRNKSPWELKYLRLEGSCLYTYEHQSSPGISPISRLNLAKKGGFIISENVSELDVPGTSEFDMPFIFRIESKSLSSRSSNFTLYIMALSQLDKRNWLSVLRLFSKQSPKIEKLQTIFRFEKNQLDINTVAEIVKENILLLGAEEGLFSCRVDRSRSITIIKGVKKVHQLTLHPQIDLALMIADEGRQLVFCDLQQLKINAITTEFSRPAINIKVVSMGSKSCHLYQIHEELLCAATMNHIILLKWYTDEDSGTFITIREFETQEPCSCVLFTQEHLIVGCSELFQINTNNYTINDFPVEENSLLQASFSGVTKLRDFPIHLLDVSNNPENIELLLCYNEFGVFLNENGNRTRSFDPIWSHMPFAFAFQNPYLFIAYFSSVEIIKVDSNSYASTFSIPKGDLIELDNVRYLGLAGSQSIYVSTAVSALEVLRIKGSMNSQSNSNDLDSL